MSGVKMKAYRLCTHEHIDPFGDLPEETPVLSNTLYQAQKNALAAAGFELVMQAPTNEAYLLFSDRIWFTTELLRKMKSAGEGRLTCSDTEWEAQRIDSRKGDYELAICPVGIPPSFEGLKVAMTDWELRDADPLSVHPSMTHAVRNLRIGPVMAIHVKHWTDVLRVNQMALVALAEEGRLKWQRAGVFGKFWMLFSLLFRARWPSKRNILAHISPRGRNCSVHPTATVEACVLGENVEIGPNAVVRASVLSDGAKVEEHASVNLSVLGKGAKVGRFAMSNLCVLYPGAMISHGGGFQASVFGEDSFMAWGSVALDLSFGSPVKVEKDGDWISSGQHFLGVCIGHRAAVGHGVKINYGVSVPNESLLVGDISAVFRNLRDVQPNVPYGLRDGVVQSIRPVQQKKSDQD